MARNELDGGDALLFVETEQRQKNLLPLIDRSNDSVDLHGIPAWIVGWSTV